MGLSFTRKTTLCSVPHRKINVGTLERLTAWQLTEILLSGTQCERVKGPVTANVEVLGVAYEVNKE